MESEEKLITASRKWLLASLTGYLIAAFLVSISDLWSVIPAYQVDAPLFALKGARRTADILLVTACMTLWIGLLLWVDNFRAKSVTTLIYGILSSWFLITLVDWWLNRAEPYFNPLYWLLALWMGLNFWGLMRSHR